MLACHLIREGVDDPAKLREQLREISGLTKFRQTLVDHFGERADLIKLDRLIERTRDLCDDQRMTLTAVQEDILDEATSLDHRPQVRAAGLQRAGRAPRAL